jgi:hypothetical protein
MGIRYGSLGVVLGIMMMGLLIYRSGSTIRNSPMVKTQTLDKMRDLDLAASPPLGKRKSSDWHRGVKVLMLYWEKMREYRELEERFNNNAKVSVSADGPR